MRILFLSRWYPYPPSNGAKLRIYTLLRSLAERHEIGLISFTEAEEGAPDTAALEPYCQDIRTVRRKKFTPSSLSAQLGFLSMTPRSVVDTFSSEMKNCIDQALSAGGYELVIASQFDMAVYAPYFGGLPALFEEAEVGVLYEQPAQARSVWQRLRYSLTWVKHRNYLARLLRYFRACTVVSERERQLLLRAAPHYKAIEVIPNCINLDDYRDVCEAAQPNSLIFSGSFRYFANYDAMQWFLGKVYAKIQSEVPDAHLTITGDHAGLPLPTSENVTLSGFLPDVRSRVASSWTSLAPIRLGGGTRLKILEAMTLGTPVVATSKGAEGLEVEPGEHLLIADTPETFARATVHLLTNPELRQRLAENACHLIQNRYSCSVVMPRFLNLVEQVR